MKTLIGFEFRKLLEKRFARISIIAVLLLSVVYAVSTMANMYSFDGEIADATGMVAIEMDKAIAGKYAGVLTDEKVQQMMSDFRIKTDLHGLNAVSVYHNVTQASVFYYFADINGEWNGLSVADVFGDEEIKIGYVYGWLSTSQNMAQIFIVLSLIIILIISPVFSGEYGVADDIILTSKYGKTKCTAAKAIASLSVSLLVTTAVVVLNILLALAIYGTDGLDCSILFSPSEFAGGYVPFNITCGTLLMYQTLLSFTGAICITGITLFLSAVCKSQLVTFATSAAVHLLPTLLVVSERNPIFRYVTLLPIYHYQGISLMSVEQMANGILYAVWAIPVAIVLIVLGILSSRRIFAGHQVS